MILLVCKQVLGSKDKAYDVHGRCQHDHVIHVFRSSD
uniref:Uncharacterized protein n=1 Tax=Arundo donax TaxID=35708 RepID=A0A0A9C9Y0_ARUDO